MPASDFGLAEIPTAFQSWGQSGDTKKSKRTGRGRTRPKQNETDSVPEAARRVRDTTQAFAGKRLAETAWIGLKTPGATPCRFESGLRRHSLPTTYDSSTIRGSHPRTVWGQKRIKTTPARRSSPSASRPWIAIVSNLVVGEDETLRLLHDVLGGEAEFLHEFPRPA